MEYLQSSYQAMDHDVHVLHEQVDAKKKVRAATVSSSRRNQGEGTPTPPMNDLKRSLKNLLTAYDKCLVPYIEARRAEANKSVRLPSLDRQLTRPLRQYDFPFNNRKKDLDGCPLCLHLSTIVVESQSDVNTKNRELRNKASADGGDGKFTAVLALHGCYCSLNNCHGHKHGYGCYECLRKAADGERPIDCGPRTCGFECDICSCDCRCVFQEQFRQKIAAGAMREKRRQEEQAVMSKNGGTTSNVSPEETGRMAWMWYIMSTIENHNVREHQHADGHSNDEIIQDIGMQMAMDAYLDHVLFSNLNVRRGLQQAIPLGMMVKYRRDDGSTRQMSFTMAQEAKRRCRGGGGAVSIDHTPTESSFLRNSNTSNRIYRNKLDNRPTCPPAGEPVAEAEAENVPVIGTVGTLQKWVMKHAGDAYFFGGVGISPGKGAKSGAVHAKLACSNPAFTLTLKDYGKEKNSQELLAMCVAQTDVYQPKN